MHSEFQSKASRCRVKLAYIYDNLGTVQYSINRLYAFVEAAALRSIVLRYAGAPIATRGSFCFVLDMSLFPSFFFVPFPLSLCITVWTREYVLRSFLPNGVFLPCDHGLDF